MEGTYITKEDLMRACADAMYEGPIAAIMKDEPMLSLMFAVFSAEICKRIFAEEAAKAKVEFYKAISKHWQDIVADTQEETGITGDSAGEILE